MEGYVFETSEIIIPFKKLKRHFCENFPGHEPDYYIEVPGKVNLIGEHVDYSGYPVCTIATSQKIKVAVKKVNDPQMVHLINKNSDDYGNISKNMSTLSVDSSNKNQCWSNYFLCGVKGAREFLCEKLQKPEECIGFLFAVTGHIPKCSGLSSSSALVTAAVMATLIGYDFQISRLDLLKISANCEKYLGTPGTEIDQAALLFTYQGYGSRTELNPLTYQPLRIPNDVLFVIAQSLVVKNEAVSIDLNTRVVECRLASQIIAKRLNFEWERMTVLAILQKDSGNTLDHMIELVHQHLHVEAYSKKEVCEILGVSENVLNKLSFTNDTIHVTEFFLHQRALHVFEEAKRTEQFCEIIKNAGDPSDLGRLMNESHSSLRDLYKCSHPDLEELVDVCKRGGALGCKLTGVGWGGCVVALVLSDDVLDFEDFVKAQFYKKRNVDQKCIFISKPSRGARVFMIHDDFCDRRFDHPTFKFV